jgi:DNA-binding NtrC family response regulator
MGALGQPNSPQLVFTGVTLPDGSWREVLVLAGQTGEPTPVIVVSRLVDLRLYINALEGGVSDFIVPPFRPPDVAWIIDHALGRGSGPDHPPLPQSDAQAGASSTERRE